MPNRPLNILLIPGTSSRAHLREDLAATDADLSRAEISRKTLVKQADWARQQARDVGAPFSDGRESGSGRSRR